jgi:hypothetical protein
MRAIIDGVPLLDLAALWGSIVGLPLSERSTALMAGSGVVFFDEARRFVRAPAVSLVGIGGLPISLHEGACRVGGAALSPAGIGAALTEMIGMGGFMSYLNPRDRGPAELAAVLAGHGHGSTAHACTLNLLISGFSVAVENELCIQRDILHLSRLTVARTHAQDDPPLVVLDEAALPAFVEARRLIAALRAGASGSLEAINNLFPAARATLALMTISVRSLDKLLAAESDPGKEREFRLILGQLRALAAALLPDRYTP